MIFLKEGGNILKDTTSQSGKRAQTSINSACEMVPL